LENVDDIKYWSLTTPPNHAKWPHRHITRNYPPWAKAEIQLAPRCHLHLHKA